MYLGALFANEQQMIDYKPTMVDRVDSAAMEKLTPAIQHLMKILPELKYPYTKLKQAISFMDDLAAADAKRTMDAEANAQRLRAMMYHIRRQWYRKRNPKWMMPFPRPGLLHLQVYLHVHLHMEVLQVQARPHVHLGMLHLHMWSRLHLLRLC